MNQKPKQCGRKEDAYRVMNAVGITLDKTLESFGRCRATLPFIIDVEPSLAAQILLYPPLDGCRNQAIT